MKFDKVYKGPFWSDGFTIWTSDGIHALDVEDAVWANGEVAAHIQDEFASWVVSKISK